MSVRDIKWSVIDELAIARKTFDDMTFDNEHGTDAYLTGRVGLTLILEQTNYNQYEKFFRR